MKRHPDEIHVDIMAFIEEFGDAHRYAPLIAEVAAGVDLAPNGVGRHVATLVRMGLLEQPAGRRTLRVAEGAA